VTGRKNVVGFVTAQSLGIYGLRGFASGGGLPAFEFIMRRYRRNPPGNKVKGDFVVYFQVDFHLDKEACMSSESASEQAHGTVTIGVPKETFPGEARVALVPAHVPTLLKKGFTVLIESGAGEQAGYPDDQYVERGAEIAKDRKALFLNANAVFQVRSMGANPEEGKKDLDLLKAGQVVIGMMEPLTALEEVKALSSRKVTVFSMELIPRITRAQSMDVLSSMATIAGYKAVLLAASTLPKMFPMMMTAAGTITPAKVLVVGAGVAGLQAIASSRRLGSIVHAYDIRPAVKQEVESLGAKFVELDLKTESAEGSGGYAKAMDEDFYRRQRELMHKVVAENDVVITTAAVPGKKAPILVTKEMVFGMAPGSVIVDLAAERGGNCELTKPGETCVVQGVTILGPVNLPSTIPHHASQMYSKNISNFALNMAQNGSFNLDKDDEIVKETMVLRDGAVVHPIVKKLVSPEPQDEKEA